jgi:hypothetical protein
MKSGLFSTVVTKYELTKVSIEKRIVETPTSGFNSVHYTELISPPLLRP